MSSPTLRGQMTRASMLTTLVALLLSGAALLVYEFVSFRDSWVADLRTQAELIAHSSEAAIVFNDPKAAGENLAVLKLRPPVRAAAIFQADGKRFAGFVADDRASLPAHADPRLLARGHRFVGSTLEVSYPIERDGELVGSVYMLAEHDVWTRAATYAAILFAVTLASLALAYFVFGRLQRVVTAPLARMTGVAQEVMERRDWTLRAPDSRNRDISVLVRSFNGMLAEVESRTGELEREMLVRQQAEAELRVLDRKKDEFLATLAHELRNPLAPMTNAVALARRSDGNAAARDKAIDILDRQLRHLVRLIDDLLDVSRIATGKLSLHVEEIDLRGVLRAAVELAEPTAAERQLQLAGHWPEAALRTVGDSARLLQVFANLLNNACRYTPPGGRIDIEASADVTPGSIEVRVRDTGVGVDPSMQQRIFDLFEQADKSLERGNAGLGIGLTLARQLVRLHGGEIDLSSEGIGRGSTFIVRLPRAQPGTAALAAAAEPAAAEAPALRIVLADDNVDFAESLLTLLEMHGHAVTMVHDGDAALAAVRRLRPDVAVLDIGMPGTNGYEVARQLRADAATAATALIAVTGWGQAADKRAAAEAGFDRHLLKPLAPDELLEVLATLAARASRRPRLEDDPLAKESG